MKHKLERNTRIMTDLVAYCHRMGGTAYHIDMKLEKDVSVFYIESAIPDLHEEELERVRHVLDVPRQHEIENSYWLLSGESEHDEDLRLLGMMVDDAKVEYSNGTLSIVVRRTEEQ